MNLAHLIFPAESASGSKSQAGVDEWPHLRLQPREEMKQLKAVNYALTKAQWGVVVVELVAVVLREKKV